MELINYRNKRYNFLMDELNHRYWRLPVTLVYKRQSKRFYKVSFYKNFII